VQTQLSPGVVVGGKVVVVVGAASVVVVGAGGELVVVGAGGELVVVLVSHSQPVGHDFVH